MSLRNAAEIARKDLRQRFRDRSAIVVGLIAPLAIAGLMSAAFKGVDSVHVSLGLANQDRGAASQQLTRVLESPSVSKIVTLEKFPTAAAATAAVKGHHVEAAIVVPAGFTASLAGASPRALEVVKSADNQIAADIAKSIVSSFTAQVNADRLSVTTAMDAGAPASRLAALEALVQKAQIPLRAVQRPIGARQLTVMSYFAPAMAIFFLLFTISYVSRSFFSDKAAGMIERMRAAPLRPADILAGKALSVFVYGIASLGTVAVVTSLAFGAHWGSPLAVAIVCIALTIAIVCLTALVIGLARTQRQSDGIASMIVFGLALLGGNFVFVSSAPPIMQRLALVTPNGWALRAFTDLSTTGGGLGAIVEPVLAILAFSAVVGGIALALAPRAVKS